MTLLGRHIDWIRLLSAACGVFLVLTSCGDVEPEPSGAIVNPGCAYDESEHPVPPGWGAKCEEFWQWAEQDISTAELIEIMADRCVED